MRTLLWVTLIVAVAARTVAMPAIRHDHAVSFWFAAHGGIREKNKKDVGVGVTKPSSRLYDIHLGA